MSTSANVPLHRNKDNMRLSATPNTTQERPKFTCQHVILGSQMTALLCKHVQLASTRLMLKNATSHTISCNK